MVGPNANSTQALYANYHGTASNPVTILEGIKNAKAADVVIFVGGLNALWKGEEMATRSEVKGFDRGDRTAIELPAIQLKILHEIKITTLRIDY